MTKPENLRVVSHLLAMLLYILNKAGVSAELFVFLEGKQGAVRTLPIQEQENNCTVFLKIIHLELRSDKAWLAYSW